MIKVHTFLTCGEEIYSINRNNNSPFGDSRGFKIKTNNIKIAADILKKGGIVVYPTETVYGVGCDPLNSEACARIQQIKKREKHKPMLLLANSIHQIEELAGTLDTVTLKLAQSFWPGPLTLIITVQTNLFEKYSDISEYLAGKTVNHDSQKSLAFRITSNPDAATLIEEFGRPITSTSANIAGYPPVDTYENALEIFENKADIVIGTNEKLSGTPSTIVDVTSDRLIMIREGSITLKQIQEVL
ncbi:L-threonylcarbamoyladenylate synthase [Candidatus Latescibacterota bacterium]